MIYTAKKFRSLSSVKGKVPTAAFSVTRHDIPMGMDEPVKRLGGVYDASVRDKNTIQHIPDNMDSGLLVIDKCRLIEKFKV